MPLVKLTQIARFLRMGNVSANGLVAIVPDIAMTISAGKAACAFNWNVIPDPVPFAWQVVLVLLNVGVRQGIRAIRIIPAHRVVFDAEFSSQTFRQDGMGLFDRRGGHFGHRGLFDGERPKFI